MSTYNDLCAQLEGRWRKNVPLKNLTTMRVGGPADLMVHPANAEELAFIIKWLNGHDIHFFILGAGSNLIIRDGGIRGVVVNMRDSFNYFRLFETGIVSGAGTGLATLAAVSARANLSGLEFAMGIPGTLGGAIRINAGAFDHSISEVLQEVKVVTHEGDFKTIPREELMSDYRQGCINNTEIVIEATLQLTPANQETIHEQMASYARWRKTHQPSKGFSAGCIFKNPPGMHAGRIIDELGLKGLQHGDAIVSDIHANFIVNRGNATACDILKLIEKIRETVREKRGIELEPEVLVVGEE
jgi:UDP-N-acetylmuramate dehydrogenase